MEQKKIKNRVKVLNYFVKNGLKHKSENMMLKTFKLLQKTSIKNHHNLMKLLIIRNTILIKVRRVRVKKRRIKEIPFMLKKNFRIFHSVKILKTFVNEKKHFPLQVRLCNEILNNTDTLDRKNICVDLQQEAYEKKKFAHFRWF